MLRGDLGCERKRASYNISREIVGPRPCTITPPPCIFFNFTQDTSAVTTYLRGCCAESLARTHARTRTFSFLAAHRLAGAHPNSHSSVNSPRFNRRPGIARVEVLEDGGVIIIIRGGTSRRDESWRGEPLFYLSVDSVKIRRERMKLVGTNLIGFASLRSVIIYI